MENNGVVLMSDADRRAKLEEGLALERSGQWQDARQFWSGCAVKTADDAVFAVRLCGAALRTGAPDIAQDALAVARAADCSGKFADVLDRLEEKTRKLHISTHRAKGVAAFDAEDFETARRHLDALAAAVPDHPWARTKARVAAGYAPGFARELHARRPHVEHRVFLTGCGRSGTWLMMAMLQGLPDLTAAPGEQPLGAFLDLPDGGGIHLVKRLHDAYLHFDRIPDDVTVLHLVRHPFDVLLSAHLGKANHISLARLEGEHAGYFAHLAPRPNTCVIRFEDMVRAPGDVQARIETLLGTRSRYPFRDFHLHAELGAGTVAAMHGLRPLDPATLHRWRADAAARTFLKTLLAQSDGTLRRFADAFGYDVTL